MKHTEVIDRLCKLQTEVTEALNDYTFAADCFCGKGGFWDTNGFDPERDYRNDGRSLEYIEQAVREKIERDKAERRIT